MSRFTPAGWFAWWRQVDGYFRRRHLSARVRDLSRECRRQGEAELSDLLLLVGALWYRGQGDDAREALREVVREGILDGFGGKEE